MQDRRIQLSNSDRLMPSAMNVRANPSVDLRTVLFTLAGSELLVALRPSEDRPALPRDSPKVSESLDHAARRLIRKETGLNEQYIEQLYTWAIDEPEGNWSIVVSYLALICSGSVPQPAEELNWQASGSIERISDVDRMVIDYAIVRLRAKLGYTNIAFHLLPKQFTLTELQRAYETILGQQLDKRNFRRRVIASGILSETTDKRRDGSHRPAALYCFRAENDAASYLTPPWTTTATGDAGS